MADRLQTVVGNRGVDEVNGITSKGAKEKEQAVDKTCRACKL